MSSDNRSHRGKPDVTRVYGDIDGDFILDRIPPYSLINNVINLTTPPPHPHFGWRITLNDADYRYSLVPIGSRWNQLALFILLWLGPIFTGIAAMWVFMKAFYSVKLNEVGIQSKKDFGMSSLNIPLLPRKRKRHEPKQAADDYLDEDADEPRVPSTQPASFMVGHESSQVAQNSKVANPKRLTVLIATMEYEIEDWGIRVKIGGLGVMSSLMGKNLKHQDLIWVIPWFVLTSCSSSIVLTFSSIGDIKYPVDQQAESIPIKVLGNMYEIKTQYHVVGNIRYVLLDAPIFRQQTKADPYPTRMDDLDSAVYYSAWNSCIAEVMKRFPIDLCKRFTMSLKGGNLTFA